MIVALPPFATFKAAEFYIGGNPDTVDTVASSWQQFGEDCDIASSNMTALDSSSFQGTEGERFTDLVHIILPSQVSALGEVHGEVGDAIGSYAEGLYVAHDAMDALVVLAEVDHAAVNAAVARHTAAEASVAAARVASAGVGGVAAPVLVAAEAELQAAKAHYYAMKTVWDSDLEKADQIKEALGEVVRATVNTIDSQARLAFDSKPAEVEEASGFFDELVDDVFEEFEEAVSAVSGTYGRLRELSEDLAFAAGKVTSAAGNAADALLGKARWGDVKKDLEAAVDTFDDNESDSRGDDDVTTAGEPVDVFSGALVDFSCDVFIDGILPIELSRSCSSSRGKEGVFGAQWASNVDCRLDVFDNRVLMLSPTGSVVRFDPPGVDGTEVRGKGRPWLLSFVDGAYRVRDVVSGLVYVFTTASETIDHLPSLASDSARSRYSSSSGR